MREQRKEAIIRGIELKFEKNSFMGALRKGARQPRRKGKKAIESPRQGTPDFSLFSEKMEGRKENGIPANKAREASRQGQ